jgi:hypothetical protein
MALLGSMPICFGSTSEKLVCRYCESDDLAPSFIKRRDRRCRECFSKRYGSWIGGGDMIALDDIRAFGKTVVSLTYHPISKENQNGL